MSNGTRDVMAVMVEPTMSVDQTATALGVGRATAYNTVRAGEWPVIRGGRRVRVPTPRVREQLRLDAELPRVIEADQ